MIITEHLRGAFGSIFHNKLRSGLSMLGIIIGIFSIIVMLAIGQGTSDQIVSRFNSLGANLITIYPGGQNTSNVRSSGNTTRSDLIDDALLAFVKDIPGVKDVSPSVSTNKQLIYGSYNSNVPILGILPIYSKLKNLSITAGGFIEESDVNESSAVAVLGYQVAQNAFPDTDPIGKEIKLGNSIFTVIGVLADFSQTNRRILVPVSTAMTKLIGTHSYSEFDIQIEDTSKLDFMKSLIKMELDLYLGVKSEEDEPYTMQNLSEIASQIEQVTSTFTLFLAGIAAISLLVGGIGVMNIMLVSVVERTREIGIRKALGATRADILMQFLVESLIISLLAGVIGILGSFGVVALINRFLGSTITAVISMNSILIAFCSVVFIGIVFGILPASKASKLKPIDALRFE